MTSNSLLSLGRDILLYLLPHMDLDSIFELRSTCHALRVLIDNEINWARLYITRFSDVNLPSQIGFLEFYARSQAKCVTSFAMQVEALDLKASPLSCTDLDRDVLKLQLQRFPDAKWLQTPWCTKSEPETTHGQAELLKAKLAENRENIESTMLALASIKAQTSSLLLSQNGWLYRKYLSTKSVADSIYLKRMNCGEPVREIQQLKNSFYAVTQSGKLIFWTRNQEIESDKSPTILLHDFQVLQEHCQSLIIGRENSLTGATTAIITTTSNELLHMRISSQGSATIKPLAAGSFKSIIPHGKSTFVVLKNDNTLSLLDTCIASFKPTGLYNVVSIACCSRACAALTNDGNVYTWGFEQDRRALKGVWAQSKTLSCQTPSILAPELVKLPGHAVDLRSSESELMITVV